MANGRDSPAYWAIAPFNNVDPDMVERTWDYDREFRTIAIGWAEAGDISGLTKDELRSVMQTHYRDQPGAWKSLWAFFREIHEGDYVIARTGRSTILGVGRVSREDAYFDREKGLSRVGGMHRWFKPNFREVNWERTDPIRFSHYVFSIPTVTRIGKHLPEVLGRLEVGA
jgi:hypothetical protein